MNKKGIGTGLVLFGCIWIAPSFVHPSYGFIEFIGGMIPGLFMIIIGYKLRKPNNIKESDK